MVSKTLALIHSQLYQKVSSSRATPLHWNLINLNRKRLFKLARLIINSFLLILLLSLTTSVKKTEAGLSMKAIESDGGVLEFAGVEIAIPAGAIQTRTPIWVERLKDSELPPLAPGMVNVTRGSGGYRFLPDGTTFDQPVSIKIPLEEGLVGDSPLGEAGVHTYYWDEERNLWVKLSKIGLDVSKKSLVSTTTHFTDMINAVLTAPDNPSPLLFNPNSIKDIAAVDPTTGVDLIEPPVVNNQGSAELSYPIQVPAGRGAFSPQLMLTYSSTRGNGWLGMGWELTVPRIDIDTRWGVPAYKDVPTYQGAERYLLNGTALVPITNDPKATCQGKENAVVEQQFAPRIETFERIILCNNESERHWEVTAKDGTRFEYGTDDQSRLHSCHLSEKDHIAAWYLRRVIDTNGNTTQYTYKTDRSDNCASYNNVDPGTSGYQGEPFVQKYLERIDYTSHLDLPARYRVEFESNCTGRDDLVVSGRTGFKVVTRCTLDEVLVSYLYPDASSDSQPVRSYELEYKPGTFGKSILSKIQVKGTDGSEFYAHTFDYTLPEYQETGSGDNPFANTVVWQAPSTNASLLQRGDPNLSYTEETGHHVGMGVGVSAKFGSGPGAVGCELGIGGEVNWEYPKPQIRHMDVNGDGIADRIWRSGGQVLVLLGKLDLGTYVGPDTTAVSGPYMAQGIQTLGSEDALGGALGVDAGCKAGSAQVSIGTSFSARKADTNRLLADVNGDGLLDLTSGNIYYPGLPRRCRDGSAPTTSICPDGLPVCSSSNVLCFGGAASFAASSMLASQVADGSDEIENDFMVHGLHDVNTDVNELAFLSEKPPRKTMRVYQQTGSTTAWGPYTAAGQRMAQDPELSKEMVRLNPVIRWDPWHTGMINLSVDARRKHTGGLDGVTVSLLRVIDPTSTQGTELLSQIHLLPESTKWHELPETGSFNVTPKESYLVVVDTLDDVPVSDEGELLDEIDLKIHIEYTHVCPLGQACRKLRPEELQHRDVTGQLAYVFDFPEDFRVSELPREDYWQIIPPLGPPRSREDGGEDVHLITGTVRKVDEVETPIHIRVRCESVRSQTSDDDTACPLGTLLWEHSFSPEELDEISFAISLPEPWLDTGLADGVDPIVALVSNHTQLGAGVENIGDLNQEGARIAVLEPFMDLAERTLPMASLDQIGGIRSSAGGPGGSGFSLDTIGSLIYMLLLGRYDAVVARHDDLGNGIKDFPSLSHVDDPEQGTFFCCDHDGPTPLNTIKEYDPYRLLFEVDGENGAEVPPEAIEWDSTIEIVSVHDLEEVRVPKPDAVVVLVRKDSDIHSYSDLDSSAIDVGVQCDAPDHVFDYMDWYFPGALRLCSLPEQFTEKPMVVEYGSAGQLAVELRRLAQGKHQAVVAEYGMVKKAQEAYTKHFGNTSNDINLLSGASYCCPHEEPVPMGGNLRVLVRDTGETTSDIYTYSDVDKPGIRMAVDTATASTFSQIISQTFPHVQVKKHSTKDDALDAVLAGNADVQLVEQEFLLSAMKDTDVSTKTFMCCGRHNSEPLNTEVERLKQGQAVFIEPEHPWQENPPVLYRVHPARQLVPFQNLQDNQELRITATVVNPHHPLIVTVTGDDFEHELGRLLVEPTDAKSPFAEPGSSVPVILLRRDANITAFSDLNQPDITIQVLSSYMDIAEKLFPQAKLDPIGGSYCGGGSPDGTGFWLNTFGCMVYYVLVGGSDAAIAEYDRLEQGIVDVFDAGFTDVYDETHFCCSEDRPRALIPSRAITKSFTVTLPEAGLYYVRGYTEASFDPNTSFNLKAELVGTGEENLLLLVNKETGAHIQTYGDANYPNINLVVADDSLAAKVVQQFFPVANVSTYATSEEALDKTLHSGDFHAMLGNAQFLTDMMASDPDVQAHGFVCCTSIDPYPIAIDVPVPTNLLKARYGAGHHLSSSEQQDKQALEENLIGEVHYSVEPYAGGHHGFFYGLFNGEEELVCIGPYPCEDREPKIASSIDSSHETRAASTVAFTQPSTAKTLVSYPSRLPAQQAAIPQSEEVDQYALHALNEGALSASSVPQANPMQLAYTEKTDSVNSKLLQPFQTGYLVLVRNRQPGEPSIKTYSDLNRPGTIILVTEETEGIARKFFPNAYIVVGRGTDIVSLAYELIDGTDALLADAQTLHNLLNDHQDIAEWVYLCCRPESPYPIYLCDQDSDNDMIPDCIDSCPKDPEDYDGYADIDGCPERNDDCSIDSDNDGIPDCFDDCDYEIEDFDGFEDSDGCPDVCHEDTDGDGITNCTDKCPYAAEDLDGNRDEDGCPDPDGSSPPPDGKIDLGPDGPEGRAIRRFQKMSPTKGDGKPGFRGADPTASVGPGGTHPSRDNSVSSSSDGEVDGALRRSSTFGLSAYAGASVSAQNFGAPSLALGVNANLGVSSTYTDLEFMDWNGDGVPDQLSPNAVTLMGRDESTIVLDVPCYLEIDGECWLYPGVRESLNTTMGLAANLGISGRGAYVLKTTSGGSPKQQGWTSGGLGLYTQASRSSTLVDRIDVNGDGLPDLVFGTVEHDQGQKNKITVRLNLGYRLGEEEDWGEIGLISMEGMSFLTEQLAKAFTGKTHERALYQSQNLSTGTSISAGGGLHVGIFGGEARVDRTSDVTVAESPLAISDINGDGLPDLLYKNAEEDKIYVRYSRGGQPSSDKSAFFDKTELPKIPNWQIEPSVPDPVDGLFTGVASWVNIARDEYPDTVSVSGSDTESIKGSVEATVFFVTIRNSYRYDSGYSFVEAGLYDVNGDGLPDRVLRSGEETKAGIQIQENRLGGANLLKVVHRPLGGRITLTYEQNTPSEDDPNSRWLLTSYTLDHEDAFPVSYKTTALSENFSYEKPYYDRYEREFFGFEKVHNVRGDGRTVETIYANRSYWLRGAILKNRVLDKDGKLYTEIENKFELEREHGSTSQANRQACLRNLVLPLKRLANDTLKTEGKTPCDVWFAKSTQTITRWLEGGTNVKQTSFHFEDYDEFGNVLKLRDEQDEGSADDLVATIKFEHQPITGTTLSAHQTALLEAHIVDRVRSIDVRQKSVTGTALRFRQGAYDDRGNLIKHETFADPDGKKIATLDIAYDSTGFIIAVTDTIGYRVDYVPDGIVNLLTKETKDSFGLTSTAKYDFRFQLPTEQLDANDQKQITAYDVYGRLSQVQGPYELDAGKASLSVDYADLMSSFPAHVTTTNLAVTPGSNTTTTTIRIATFVDGLGREIQAQADGEVDGKVGRIISGRVEFDAAGRRSTLRQPVFKAGIVADMQIEDISDVSAFPGTGRITEWEYDVLDRTIKITEPGNRISTTTYDISGHPRVSNFVTRRSKITDPEGKIRFEHRDAADRLVAVVQVLDGRDLVTSYEYRPTGELAAITDALNHGTTLEYDLTGQRTSVTTPDTGRLEFGYDANGNLVEKTDQAICPHSTNLLQTCNNNEKIRYEYDKNRLVLINYPDPESTDVQFIYGDGSASGECNGQNIQGRVCKTIDGGGIEQTSYGALGEVVQHTRIMRGAAWETTKRTFVTEFVYDSFGRMLSMVYPDGEKLTYLYDAGGQAKSVTGQKGTDTNVYVKDIQYNEFGQRSRLVYGNGIETTFVYEPDTRWLDLETIRSPTAADPLRTVNYDYDKAGNINKVTDARTGKMPFLKQANRVYSYDDLHRIKTYALTAHEADAASQPIVVSAGYDYDDVGNIASQKIVRQQGTITLADYPSRNWTYQYGNANRPNLPDIIGPYSFTYDQRGAILTMARQNNSDAPLGATYTWDEEGRLRSSKRQGSTPTTQYAYNADGQRMRKETAPPSVGPNDPADTTVYPNEFYTARFARTATSVCESPPCWEKAVSRSKHIQVDGQRLAVTAAVVDSANVDNEENKLAFLAIVSQYFHSDPVGSTTLLTDKDGERAQEIDYLPFGEVLFEYQAASQPQLPEAYRFDGKELDRETGLQYFGARYYDPRVGRWISGDPLYRLTPDIGITNPNVLNLFSFSLNNPVAHRDVMGLSPKDAGPTDSGTDVSQQAESQQTKEAPADRDLRLDAGAAAAKEYRIQQLVKRGGTIQTVPCAGGTGVCIKVTGVLPEHIRYLLYINAAYYAIGAGVAVPGAVAGAGAGAGAGLATSTSSGFVVGLYGMVSRSLLQKLALAGGPTTYVVTQLTQAPVAGRALSVATGPGAGGLAASARNMGQIFQANIPTRLIMEMERAGLVIRSTTSMLGKVATELAFQPQATEFITKFFK